MGYLLLPGEKNRDAGLLGHVARGKRHGCRIDKSFGKSSRELRHSADLNDRNIAVEIEAIFNQKLSYAEIRRCAKARDANPLSSEVLDSFYFRRRHDIEGGNVDNGPYG